MMTIRKSLKSSSPREQARSFVPWLQDFEQWVPLFVANYGKVSVPRDRIALFSVLDALDDAYTRLENLGEGRKGPNGWRTDNGKNGHARLADAGD